MFIFKAEAFGILENENSLQMITLRANESASEGALITMDDQSGSPTIKLDADDDGQGGTLSLANESGSERVRIEANDAAGQGAELKMEDDDGTETINIDADFASRGGAIFIENEVGADGIELLAR